MMNDGYEYRISRDRVLLRRHPHTLSLEVQWPDKSWQPYTDSAAYRDWFESATVEPAQTPAPKPPSNTTA